MTLQDLADAVNNALIVQKLEPTERVAFAVIGNRQEVFCSNFHRTAKYVSGDFKIREIDGQLEIFEI